MDRVYGDGYRDKKYDEALGMIQKDKDMYSLFLRAQIYLSKSTLS
jgi:hypothetical protein